MAKVKKSKNQLRREKQKLKKIEGETEFTTDEVKNEDIVKQNKSNLTSVAQQQNEEANPEKTKLILINNDIESILSNVQFSQFKHVFDRFHTEVIPEEDVKGSIMVDDEEEISNKYLESSEDEESKDDNPKISKKKLRKQQKIPLSELKASSKYPELVQWYDVDAGDPKLVVELKTKKNFIPVPIHWQFKREYLSGRRGIEKKAFTLPKYISETGITDMRDTTKEDEKSLKQISREKVQPKMSKLDMDYQRLYDAFFKFQTKPRLYGYGDVYFEGKEVDDDFEYKDYKPGIISDTLRTALGIPKGVSPPWVIKMKSIGPPPSYPGLKIPGFNIDLNESEIGDLQTFEAPIYNDVDIEPFGKLMEYESSEEEYEEDENEEEGDNDEEDDNEENIESNDENNNLENGQQLVTSAHSEHKENPTYEQEESDDEDIPLAAVQSPEITEPKKLYEILKEKVTSDAGFLSSGLVYEVPSDNKRKIDATEQVSKRAKVETTNDDEDDDEDDDDDDDDDNGGKFKF